MELTIGSSAGKLKLNTDSTHKHGGGGGGFGGLFRDESGAWISGYYGRLEICTCLEAKLWAVYKGLTIILQRGFHQVIIETDMEQVVKLLSEDLGERCPFRDIVKDARIIMRGCDCSIKHIRREANICADVMAKLGEYQPTNLLIVNEPPEELHHLLVADSVHLSQKSGGINNCGCIQIIDGHGTFKVPRVQKFQTDVKLADYKLSYALVSIIGPQSSGKSTLLNNVFGTTFAQMDTLGGGRARCTDGIWLERAAITEPCILVMDLEGTDGKEKQENTTFEKQSAGFALLISDVVLINMWYHEIGRQKAANRPLFETVFQAVARLWSRRKTTLMFVIHDTEDIKPLCEMSREAYKYSKFSEEDWKAKQKATLKEIEDSLKEDIRQIWDSFSKLEAHKRTPFSAFYNVEVVFLSHPRVKEPLKNELARLRQEFHHSIVPGALAGDREGVVDGSSFSCNAQLIWKKIKENNDLDLPGHKIMVATVRCKQIAEEKFESFVASKEWLKLCKAVQTQTILDLGKELSEMIKNCLSSYDEEATYLDRDVKLKERKQLEEKLVQHVRPTYQDILQRIKSECRENFKKAFNALHGGGEELIVVARQCVNSTITEFEEKCRDARIDQANRDKSVELLRELKWHMASHIFTVAKRMHGKDRTNFKKMLTKGSALALTPSSSEPALNNASKAAAAITGAVLGAVGVAALVATAVATGVGVGVGVAAAAAAAAEDEKRKMTEVIDYIVVLLNLPSSVCKENQLNEKLLEGPSSVCGEN